MKIKFSKKTKITCFTINAFDNGYYKDGLPVDEANRKMWLYNVEKYSHIFDFKIYDYSHPLVIECKEKYKEFFDRKEIWPTIKTDVIRLYILSKLPYHLYIDDDVVLLGSFKIEDEEDYFFSDIDPFCCIYNGNSLDVFKKFLEIYPFDDKQLEEIEINKCNNNFPIYNIKRVDRYIIQKFSDKIKNQLVSRNIIHYSYVYSFINDYLYNDIEINKLYCKFTDKVCYNTKYELPKKFFCEEYLVNKLKKENVIKIEKNEDSITILLK